MSQWFKRIVDGRTVAMKCTGNPGTHSGINHFCVEGSVPRSECLLVQQALGLHPCGYGFRNHRVVISTNTNKLCTKWECFDNCD